MCVCVCIFPKIIIHTRVLSIYSSVIFILGKKKRSGYYFFEERLMKWVQDNCMDKRRHEVDVENFFRFNDCKNHLFIFLILSGDDE